MFTAPFYAGAAFSIAAFAAEELTETTVPATMPQFLLVLVVGTIIFASAVYDFALSAPQGWNWMLLPIEAVPGALGAYLVLLAFNNRTGGLAEANFSERRSAAARRIDSDF